MNQNLIRLTGQYGSPHAAGAKYVTREAIYCDDIPSVAGKLYMALTLSIQSHAEMVSNDTSAVFGREETRGCVMLCRLQ